MEIQIPPEIRSLMQRLTDHGYEAYVIGGAVRDSIAGIEPKDWDIFTNADGDEIKRVFSDKQTKVMGGELRQEKILTVIVDNVEISQFRKSGDRTETGSSLKEHLATCDITINAMATGLDGRLIDPHHGQEDLADRIIRAVGDAKQRIAEDKLRAMRAVRFAAKLKGTITPDLAEAIRETDLTTLPPERTTEELLKILQYTLGAKMLFVYDILEKLLPEIKPIINLDGGFRHRETVLEHSLFAFEAACAISDDPIFRFAVLVHDIGKGYSQEPNKHGGISFPKHDIIGVDVLLPAMERMKFSKEQIRYTTTMVANHMLHYTAPGRKAAKRIFANLVDNNIAIEDLICLVYCDNQGNLGQPRQSILSFLKDDHMLKLFYEVKFLKEPLNVKQLMVKGGDVIELGIAPSPLVGKILNQLFEEVNDGKLMNERASLMLRLREIVAEIPKT